MTEVSRPSQPVTVRALAPGDEGVWRRLFADYLAFYETVLPDPVIRSTFARLTGGDPAMFGRVAVVDGTVVGIANCILHPGTFSDAPRCYLEDLFVDRTLRGGGVGKALIDDLLETGRRVGWHQVYWHTRETNATARRLYDRYGPAEDFVCYRLDVDAD